MTETLREALDRGNPNNIADIARALHLGTMLTQNVPRCMHNAAPVDAATYGRIALPDYCKARRILNAFAHAGGGTLGNMTIHAWGAAPGANEISIDGNGDIITRHADLYTDLDVQFEPVVGDVIELNNLPVVPGTGVCTLPLPAATGAFHLISATAVLGTVTGACNVIWPAAAAPVVSRQANINLVGTIVYFVVADAVTRCNVKLIKQAAVEPHALLIGTNINEL